MERYLPGTAHAVLFSCLTEKDVSFRKGILHNTKHCICKSARKYLAEKPSILQKRVRTDEE